MKPALVLLHKVASYLLASHDLPSVTHKSRFLFSFFSFLRLRALASCSIVVARTSFPLSSRLALFPRGAKMRPPALRGGARESRPLSFLALLIL